jgi:hypothetical protein
MQLPLHPSDSYAAVNLWKYKILHRTCVGYEATISSFDEVCHKLKNCFAHESLDLSVQMQLLMTYM